MVQEIKPKATLVGTDGNVFALMGVCSLAMKDYGRKHSDYNATELVEQMSAKIFKSGSYSEALGIMSNYVEVS